MEVSLTRGWLPAFIDATSLSNNIAAVKVEQVLEARPQDLSMHLNTATNNPDTRTAT
jgi:hypothetical protein